ncbi:MAG: cation-translocating P-type ATPase [Pseudomonadota bacterium]
MDLKDNAYWSRPWRDVLQEHQVDLLRGLGPEQVRYLAAKYGPNQLMEAKPQSWWSILLHQVKSLIVFFLLAAAALSFAFKDYTEAVAILAVVLINTFIGFVTEVKGVRSVEALRKLGDLSARVRRDGQMREIPAQELVPGDVVLVEGGDIISADLRLARASKLEADESVLTGESFPIAKGVDPLPVAVPLAERRNMLFKGTVITRGSGEAVVVSTGMATELGRISSLVDSTKQEATPLEKLLNHLGNRLIWISLAIAALVALVGVGFGKDLYLMIETSIALAVAAIPEGLPIVATIALARGVWRMAQRHALIKRLSAVETLGATSVICTDKTGTLTENRMTVTEIVLPFANVAVAGAAQGQRPVFTSKGAPLEDAVRRALQEALETAVLCNNASLGGEDHGGQLFAIGDPLEAALLTAGGKAGIERHDLVLDLPEVREDAFDSDTKMMATFHVNGEGYRVAVKGAPEPVLEACAFLRAADGSKELSAKGRDQWLARNNEMAARGLRVLALAAKTVSDHNSAPYQDLHFLGLVGLLDPPRPEVAESIASCRQAGIKVVMVTGDQAITAMHIASAVGLADGKDSRVIQGQDLALGPKLSEGERAKILQTSIFSRVSPGQKLDLIDFYQTNGFIVAMTGDGVNDAPALKKADIGVAMGRRGTQVAREAADMILTDDSFPSIVHAIEQGRVIFENIRTFLVYLLSCNLSEIMTVSLPSLVKAPLPLLPLQILFLNLVTDVFPALALAAGEGTPGLMNLPPRGGTEPILTRARWFSVMVYGLFITSCVLAALALALFFLKFETQKAISVSFLTLAFAQLWHVFNMRDPGSGLLRNNVVRNPFVWGALLLCTLLLLATVYLPSLSLVLKVVDPGVEGWALVLAASLTPLVLGEAYRQVLRARGRW